MVGWKVFYPWLNTSRCILLQDFLLIQVNHFDRKRHIGQYISQTTVKEIYAKAGMVTHPLIKLQILKDDPLKLQRLNPLNKPQTYKDDPVTMSI